VTGSREAVKGDDLGTIGTVQVDPFIDRKARLIPPDHREVRVP